MRIALCSSYVPFVLGGARNIVDWLALALGEAGHEVEIVYLPQHDDPDMLFAQMAAFRWLDLDAADRVVCFRPQSHLVRHRHKVVWFIHHIRRFYDLWDSPYRGFPDDEKHRGIREALRAADTAALSEAQAVFTNSQVVSDRLMRFNGLPSEVLYPPVYRPEQYHFAAMGDEILYVSRLEHHKRQHLLIEALAHTRTPVRVRLAGAGWNQTYPNQLAARIAELGVADRVTLENGWISDERKIELMATCLAVAYLPHDEDSYGYPSLEGSHSRKPVLTTTDAGGVTELVVDGSNGLVVEPDPVELARAMDQLYTDRTATELMGRRAEARLAEIKVSWSHVVDRITA